MLRHAVKSGRVIRGVVFGWQELSFQAVHTPDASDLRFARRRVGVVSGDLLDVVNTWPEAEQQRAFSIIKEMEDEALLKLEVMPGAVELCRFLDEMGLPRGLITRNVKRGIEQFHDNAFPLRPFHPAVSRECDFPYKPAPDALVHICAVWGVPPHEVVMVGDSAKDDVVCGNRAGAVTILLDQQQQYAVDSALQGEMKPTHKVASLADVSALLQSHFVLLRPDAPEALDIIAS